MANIHFDLRVEKPQLLKPLRLSYTFNKQRKFFGIGLKCLKQNWDKENERFIYIKDSKTVSKELQLGINLFLSKADVDTYNGKLAQYKSTITEIESSLKRSKEEFDVNRVLDEFVSIEFHDKPKKDEIKAVNVSADLFSFIDEYIETFSIEREAGSLKVYRNLKNHLQDYSTYTKKPVSFDAINYSFFQSFQRFLIDKHHYFPQVVRGKKTINCQPLSNITIAKLLSTLKTFLNYARLKGIEVNSDYSLFKLKRDPLEVIALTSEEFEKLFYLDLSGNERLSKVRDLFCFSCATGLRFSDIMQLKREHIKDDEIRLVIKKTKQNHTIPLNPYSKTILDRYSDNYYPLPKISNQKANAYLNGYKDTAGEHKGLCEIAGINDPVQIVRFYGTKTGNKRVEETYPKHQLITFHTGRKTFCTLSLEKGMAAEDVMSLSGHKSYAAFKRYVNITEQRKKVVMQKYWGEKISDTILKVV